MAEGRHLGAGHLILFGIGAFFIAQLLNSFLKNWLNVNLASLAASQTTTGA
jgi:hypothetical protein